MSLVCYGFNEEELLAEFFNKATEPLDPVVRLRDHLHRRRLDRPYLGNRPAFRKGKQPHSGLARNDRNRDVGYSFKRGLSLAENEYVFWQTIDWSYDISDFEDFPEAARSLRSGDRCPAGAHQAIVLHPGCEIDLPGANPIRRHVPRAIVSLTNYYVLRILFGLNVHDFQNIQFHRTEVPAIAEPARRQSLPRHRNDDPYPRSRLRSDRGANSFRSASKGVAKEFD